MIIYNPSRCRMSECALPFQCCADCEFNPDVNRVCYSVYSNPHGHYQFERGLNPFICYSKRLK